MGAWAELDPFAAGWIRVGEIQGLLKKLPPPLNAEYLPIPVDATTLARVRIRIRARVS